MRYRKTYGVRNMMEWTCIIPVGKSYVHVPFKDGGFTETGCIPAEFVTDDAGMQLIIETSEYFKNGRIRIIRASQIKDPDEEKYEAPQLKEVEVHSVQEAKDYLMDNHGAKTSDLRSREAVVRAGKEYGIQFSFL